MHVSQTTSDDFPIEEATADGLMAPEKALVGELAPLEIQQSIAMVVTHGSNAKEVTIRQVAPLVLILTGATFLNTMSVQAVIILLPHITRDLSIPSTRQEWIVSAYALTSGSFLLLFGKLADVYGKRGLFLLGCLWVTATALGTAFSPVEICMYVMRALHGLGAALTIPTAIGIIGYTIPPGRVKNYSFAFFSGGAPIGQILGNLLGGIISQFTSWKVVFFVIAGLSFLVAITALFVIPKESPRKTLDEDQPRASGVDWIGAFLFTSGALLLLIGLSEGVSKGWDTSIVISSLVIAVVLLVTFASWQHYLETKSTKEPLMRVSTFANPRFSFAMIIVLLFSAGFTNFLVYSTYFYQDYQNFDPIQTTIRYLPLGICGILSIIGSGYLIARVRGNYILIFGLSSASISNLLFSVPIPPSTSYFAYGFPAMCLAAFGADTVYPCLGLFTTQALPRKDQSIAGAMFQTAASLGRAMFLPVMAAVQIHSQEKYSRTGGEAKQAYLEGLRAAEWVCTALSLLSLLVVILGLRNIGKIGLSNKLGEAQLDAKEKVSEA